MQFEQSKIIIFAKEPIPGKVKTRLNLSDQLSVEVFSFLLKQIVAKMTKAKLAKVELCVAGDKQHPLFTNLQNQYPITLTTQSGENLGDKMSNALIHALKKYHSVALIGSDCLEMTSKDVEKAFQLVQIKQAVNVLQPSYDGGFVMIVANQFSPQLFENVEWGSTKVLQQVLNNQKNIAVKIEQIRTVNDIDLIEGLVTELIKLNINPNYVLEK